MGPILAPPGPENDWHGNHVARLAAAYGRVTGRDLAAELGLSPAALGLGAWEGKFAFLSHRGDAQATLNYGNRFALDLWECDWAAFTAMPSAATAPGEDVAARAAMMAKAAADGFVDGYRGRRISSKGRLFMIEDATVWRLREADGMPFGAAALVRQVTFL